MVNPERQNNNPEIQQENPREGSIQITESKNCRTVLDCITQREANEQAVFKIGDREVSRESYQDTLGVVSNLKSEKEKLLAEQSEAGKEDRVNIQREIDQIDAEIEEKKKVIEKFEEWETAEIKKEQERAEKENRSSQNLLTEIANPEKIDQQIGQLTKEREDLARAELPITEEAQTLDGSVKEKKDLEELARTSDRAETVRIRKEIAAIESSIDKLAAQAEEAKQKQEEARKKELEEKDEQIQSLANEKKVVDRLTTEIANPEKIDQQIDQLAKEREDLARAELPTTEETRALNGLVKEKEDLEDLARTSDPAETARIKKESTKIEVSIDKLAVQAEEAKQKQEEARKKELEEKDEQIQSLANEKKVVDRLLKEMDKSENEALKKTIEIKTGKRKSPEQEKRDETEKRYQELSRRLETQKNFVESKNFPEIFKQLRIKNEEQQQIIEDAEKWFLHKQKLMEEKKKFLPRLEKKFLGIDFNKKKRQKVLVDIKYLEESSAEFREQRNKAMQEIEKNNQEEVRAGELRNVLAAELTRIEQEQVALLEELKNI